MPQETNLSVSEYSSHRSRPYALMALILAVAIVTVVYTLSIISVPSPSPSSSVYSTQNFTVSYPSTWSAFNVSNPVSQSFLNGQTTAFFSPAGLSPDLSNGSHSPPGAFAIAGVSYNSTVEANLSSLPSNVAFLLDSGADTVINNVSIGGCAALSFQSRNVSGSLLSVSGAAVQEPNIFLYTKIICSNKVYQFEAEAVGSAYTQQLLNASRLIQSTLKSSFIPGSIGAKIAAGVSTFSISNYTTTFSENGLPIGTSWSVAYNGTTKFSTASQINFTTTAGTYPYSVSKVLNSSSNCTTYTPNPASGNLAAGGNLRINFSSSTLCTTVFKELGLPSGTLWGVTYAGISSHSSSNSIAFSTFSGLYSFYIPDIYSNCTYTPISNMGRLYHGALVGYLNAGSTLNVTFVSSCNTNSTTSTTFLETGLPGGLYWSAAYAGLYNITRATSMAFSTASGNYSFYIPDIYSNCTYTPISNMGRLYHGALVGYLNAGSTLNVTFVSSCNTNSTTSTTFLETGLPSGTLWGVTYAGISSYSSSNSIAFSTLSGLYSFSIPDIYYPCTLTPMASVGYLYHGSRIGNLTAGNTLRVNFVGSCASNSTNSNQTNQSIIKRFFIEIGLPAGMAWGLFYNNMYHYSSTNIISINVAPGNNSVLIPVIYYPCTLVPRLNGTMMIRQQVPGYGAIYGGFGNDVIHGGGGNDYIFGGPGGDIIHGGPGNDNHITFSGSCSTISVPRANSTNRSAVNLTTNVIESGLPAGTYWELEYAGRYFYSSTNSFSVAGFNGTHPFSIPDVYGRCTYTANATGAHLYHGALIGNLTAGTTLGVSFINNCNSSGQNTTTFTESGLPNSTYWGVNYDGVYKYSSRNTISFSAAPGIYPFSISDVYYPCTLTPNSSVGYLHHGQLLGNLTSGSRLNFNFMGSCAT